MHAHAPNHGQFDITATPSAASGRTATARAQPSQAASRRYSSHGRAALATALDDGLTPDEVRRILSGRRVVDAFPVGRGESPAAYAARAVSEMFVAYLD